MSADVARLVLTNCTLRWSSPILFNDPFDVPRELSFGITGEALHLAVGRKLTQLIESPPDDTTQMDPTLRVVVETVKRGIPAKLKAEMLSGLQDIGREERSEGGGMDAMRNLWRRLLPDHRILCLTESAAHTAMWYHYADKYRGIVLEFDCIDELESPWLIAKPVTYSEKSRRYTPRRDGQKSCAYAKILQSRPFWMSRLTLNRPIGSTNPSGESLLPSDQRIPATLLTTSLIAGSSAPCTLAH